MIEDHKIILNMIEDVDQSDTEKLDEIDARFWCYLNKWKFAGIHKGVIFTKDEETQCEITTGSTHAGYKYTRSRDALKEIRPKDFVFYMETATDNWGASKLSGISNNTNFESPILPTEELAELHAIIQAIAYEREKK